MLLSLSVTPVQQFDAFYSDLFLQMAFGASIYCPLCFSRTLQSGYPLRCEAWRLFYLVIRATIAHFTIDDILAQIGRRFRISRLFIGMRKVLCFHLQ